MLRRLATGDERTIHDAVPPLSSTKALSGHSLGAASVHEAIYGLLMMRDGFMAASNHIEQLDERCEGFPILRETHDAKLDTVMSNSFGFGGPTQRWCSGGFEFRWAQPGRLRVADDRSMMLPLSFPACRLRDS